MTWIKNGVQWILGTEVAKWIGIALVALLGFVTWGWFQRWKGRRQGQDDIRKENDASREKQNAEVDRKEAEYQRRVDEIQFLFAHDPKRRVLELAKLSLSSAKKSIGGT